MNEKNLLWLLLAVTGLTLYITYRTAVGLQGAQESVDRVRKNPILKAFGL